MKDGNLYSHLPEGPIPAEAFETLASGAGCRIERIVSTGHATPDGEWMDQDWDEWVLLVAGGAALAFEGEIARRHLAPGDWLHIRAGTRHRVAWTSRSEVTVWLAVHYPAP